MGDLTRYVLLNIDGGSAGQWIRWAKRRAAEAGAEAGAAELLELPAPEPQSAAVPGDAPPPVAELLPEPDPAVLLRQARNAALRAGRGSWA
jgi:hypothetical protein